LRPPAPLTESQHEQRVSLDGMLIFVSLVRFPFSTMPQFRSFFFSTATHRMADPFFTFFPSQRARICPQGTPPPPSIRGFSGFELMSPVGDEGQQTTPRIFPLNKFPFPPPSPVSSAPRCFFLDVADPNGLFPQAVQYPCHVLCLFFICPKICQKTDGPRFFGIVPWMSPSSPTESPWLQGFRCRNATLAPCNFAHPGPLLFPTGSPSILRWSHPPSFSWGASCVDFCRNPAWNTGQLSAALPFPSFRSSCRSFFVFFFPRISVEGCLRCLS